MTWSRSGLIGVTARSRRANRVRWGKAAKTAPRSITLNNHYDWLAIDLANAEILEITGGEWSRKISSLTRVALQEARKALANVIAHCDREPDKTPIHNLAILYTHDCEANAVRSCLPEHCVSGRRSCDPTIMLSSLSTNNSATLAYCQYRSYTVDVIGQRLWLRRRLSL